MIRTFAFAVFLLFICCTDAIYAQHSFMIEGGGLIGNFRNKSISNFIETYNDYQSNNNTGLTEGFPENFGAGFGYRIDLSYRMMNRVMFGGSFG